MKRLFHKHAAKSDHVKHHISSSSASKKRPVRTSVTAIYGHGSGVHRTYGCVHYARKCAYVSPCCQKVYSCRICHDAAEDHKIDRFQVNEIQCSECKTVQGIRQVCVKCGEIFGRYFCQLCRMFDDIDKQQFHCDKCGLCRVGGRENFFHCDKCDVCLCILLKDSHTCVEKVTHSDCPVCLDDLHTSRETLHILSCGHVTHESCWIEMLKSGNFSCPMCGHTMLNMENVWRQLDQMIAQAIATEKNYHPTFVWILCRDCHQRCEVEFHRLGLKCKTCGSYNTCRDELTTASQSQSLNSRRSSSLTNGISETSVVDHDLHSEPVPTSEPSVAASTNFNTIF